MEPKILSNYLFLHLYTYYNTSIVKNQDIHIKLKSYKLELLGEVVVEVLG